MTEEEFKNTIANNLVYFRKKIGITQLQLAEKLNYSDKAISKWERGESIPDMYTMQKVADFYGVSLNDFLIKGRKLKLPKSNKVKILITILSGGLVWLVATVIYVFLFFAINNLPQEAVNQLWKTWIAAIPGSLIVFVVFTEMWSNNIWIKLAFVSALIWAVGLCLYLCIPFEYMWAIFILCGVVQILAILWYVLRNISKPKVD